MTTDNTLRVMEGYLPLLKQFKSKTLAGKVANVWYRLWKDSKWSKLEDAVWNPLCPGVRLLDHTNAVAKAALHFSQVRQEIYGEAYDSDILLAGAMLHDSSKLLEVDPDGQNGVTSKKGRFFQHAFLGAHRALLEGLPDEVVHIIISHTGQSRLIPLSPEAILIYAIDLADADISRLKAGAPLLMQKHK